MVQFALVTACATRLVATWPGEDFAAAPSSGERRAVSPTRLAAYALALLASLFSLHAAYQVIGPESLPGTYAAQAAVMRAYPEEFDPATYEGVLHALTEAGRAAGRLGSPNLLAGLIALALPLTAALALTAAARWKSVLWMGGLLAQVWALVLTGSRGGVLGGALGLGALGVLWLLGRRRPHAVPIAAVFVLSSIGLTGAAPPAPESGSRWFGGTTVLQRIAYWETGIAIWREQPLLGAGPGAYATLYPQHRRPGAQETSFAHNWVIQQGAESGAVGVLLFSGLALAAAWLGLRAWRRASGEERVLLAGLLASLAAAVGHGLVEITLASRELLLDVGLVAGVLAGAGCRAMPTQAVSREAPAVRIAAGGVALLLAAGLWITAVRPAVATFHAQRASVLLLDGEPPEDAVAEYTGALGWTPGDAALWEARAVVRARTGDPRAGDDLTRAMALAPHSARLRQTAAGFAAARGLWDEALRLQREAIALHPLDGSHRLNLARLQLETGDRAAARETVAALDGLLLSTLEQRQRADIMARLEPANGAPRP
jgi:Flp pilus assembly protein TadD